MAYSSSGMNTKTGTYHPDAMKHMLSKSSRAFSDTKAGKKLGRAQALKKRTSSRAKNMKATER